MAVHIIYASTSGNVEWIVEQLAELSRLDGIAVELHRAEQTSPDVITNNKHFFLATSTWEHGELNAFYMPLYKALQQIDCTGKQASFFGLGDIRYEPVHFCRGIDFLKQRWLERGGTEVGVTFKLNGDPFHQTQDLIFPWWQKELALWKEIV
jgi:flavodoxin I